MTYKLPSRFLRVIKEAKDGAIPRILPNEEKEKIDTLKQLVNEGYLSGNVKQIYSKVILENIAVELKGEAALHEASFMFRFTNALHNVSFGTWNILVAMFVLVAGGLALELFKG